MRVSTAGGVGAGGVDSDGEGHVVKDSFHKRAMQGMCAGWKLCVSENLKDQCGWHTDGEGEKRQRPGV